MRIGLRKAPWVLAGLVCLLCLGNPAWAGVELELPENMTAVAVNGENRKVEGRVRLPDGMNQVVVQFVGILGSRYDDDADMGYSDVFVVKFEGQNQALKMEIPRIKRSLDLEKFNRESDIRIVNAAGRTVACDIAKLEKEGFQVFRDFAKELEDFNQTDSPAAVNVSRSVSGEASPAKAEAATDEVPSKRSSEQTKQSEPIPQQPGPEGSMAEKMLKYWYQQADEATRERFKRWINQ